MRKIFLIILGSIDLFLYICRKFSANMDNIDIELSKVIDAAVQSSIDIGQVASLKDLYKERTTISANVPMIATRQGEYQPDGHINRSSDNFIL